MNRLLLVFILILLQTAGVISAQNLDSILAELSPANEPAYTLSTFKSTRVVLGQSVELPPKEDLTFIISHRFGNIQGGFYDFFGLDQAYNRLGLEYGIGEVAGFSVGRNSYEKTYDGALKIKLLRQQKGVKDIPVTVTWYSGMFVNTLTWSEPDRENLFTSRLAFVNQVMVSRKFSKKLSLQVTPSHIHRNLVERNIDQNDVFAIGFSGKYQFARKISLNAEYFWLVPGQTADDRINNFSLGFDFETGGHVFQLHATNARGTTEQGFITETTGRWLDGDIFLGFSIYRIFPLDEKRKNIY